LLVGVMAIALSIGLRLTDPPVIKTISLSLFDTYQRIKPREYRPVPVRIIEIDEDSLKRLGQWPWPRPMIAELTRRLTQLGASGIGFDIVFAEPDRTTPKVMAGLWRQAGAVDAATEERIIQLPDHDEIFAEVLGQTPSVLGFVLSGTPPSDAEDIPKPKAGIAYGGSNPIPFLNTYPGMTNNLPLLREAAPGAGYFSQHSRDPDRIIRRIALFSVVEGQIYPSLVAETLRVAQGASSFALKSSDASGSVSFGDAAGVIKVKIGGAKVPTTANSSIWIYYTEDVPERYIPAWKILGDIETANSLIEQIQGHIVLIGTSAPGLEDLRATPINSATPGVSIHAQAMEQILLGDYLVKPDWADGLENVLMVAGPVLLIFLLPGLGAIWCAAIGGILAASYLGGSWYAFSREQLLVSPVFPIFSASLTYVLVTGWLFIKEQRDRAFIRDAFRLYLAPALVDKVADNQEQLILGGEIRELTIMFSDIRGFTAFSEGMTPQELTLFINEYLTPMCDVLLNHGATIDKFIGDAVMAFWNAPLDVPDHARRACDAVLDSKIALARLNEGFAERTLNDGRPFPELRIGVGLNTGDCCVGNLGSDQRFNYSCLGDAVNVASRVEGQSKSYGVFAVVGETTHAQCDDYALIELDLIRVKGKLKPIRIYSLLGNPELEQSAVFQSLKQAHEGAIKAFRAQLWDEADALFGRAREIGGDEWNLHVLYNLYDARVANYREASPGDDWDGVYIATSK